MFTLTYLRRELRHRSRQALLVATGLAVGVGLVITVTASTGAVGSAQTAVLDTLNGIGTDVTATAKPPPNGDRDHAPSDSRARDASTPGLSVAGGASMDASTVDAVARLAHVAHVAGSLVLSEIGPPPAGSAAIPTTTRIDGIDVTRPGLGPYTSATLRSGRSLSPSDTDSRVAVIDTRYAAAHQLRIGSTLVIAGIRFTTIGVVDQPAASGAASIYLPLAAAQQLPAGQHAHALAGKVSTIYIAATSAADIGTVGAELAALLPSATVTSSRDLAEAVSGSLASATALAHDLGTWLTVGVLLATVATASLLTLASVTRRTREFGTLKALGWTGRRVITQVVAESAAIGLAGAALGVAVGYCGIGLVNAIAPALTATVDDPTGTDSQNVAVHLNVHTGTGTIAAATLLAITAALIAGAIAAWSITRLQPAHALTATE
ncbi:ABC transporter permease [Rugosimonospora africana]|uniref:Membrane protein n=1 Tax=Rugosimonospora africana TaxID=556532 RepID=A0A8J3VVA8_9ACTN|nr:ABC transporter permease [Rugosimonospora africana]GIH19528.1 membrane protein [Rugosimonospora africana]